MMMPGLGGLEVLKAIRERSPRMPVILLTGQGISSEQGVEGLRLGAFALLMKPPDLGELLEWIGKAAEADS
jgi:DNA-binding NtrC family response regulator